MLPTLSQIHAWDTEHLITAATYWNKTADRWEDVFIQMRNRSHTILWEGAGGEALRQRTGADLTIVSAKADQLRQAARIARDGAGTIGTAQRRVIYAIDDARGAGFKVDEDLSVTERPTSGTVAQQAARQAQAKAIAADIRRRVTQLIEIEHETAARIINATAEIAESAFPEPFHNHEPGIHAVDEHNFKQDPVPAPSTGPEPAKGPSTDDIRRVLDKLPQGNKPEIREVRSQQDLENLWKWAQQNGEEIPNGYGDPGKGIRYRLPDGTIVGQRWSAGSTSKPVLDFDIPSNGGYTKIHINARGGVPEIPAPVRAAPAEAPPVRVPAEPPSLTRPPTEPMPGRFGPAPPLAGGGLVPPESTPHPVHPPHSHHGPPVMGKDELADLDEFTGG